MKVTEGIEIIKRYFPDATVPHGVMRDSRMPQRLHTLGLNPPKDLGGLIREMDSLGIGIRDGKIVLF